MSPRYGRTVSLAHVIWAYEDTIMTWHREGLSAPQIRQRLIDECSLTVAVDSVRDVLNANRASV